jgi:hypothetical protein
MNRPRCNSGRAPPRLCVQPPSAEIDLGKARRSLEIRTSRAVTAEATLSGKLLQLTLVLAR